MIAISTTRAVELTNLGYQNNPFVAWNNLGAAATLGGANVFPGGERENAVTGSTYDKWRPDFTGTAATLSFDFGSAISIGFAAMAAHNVHTFGASVAVQRSTDNVNWSDAGAGTLTPTDGSVMAWRMSATAAQYWRFRITGLTVGNLVSVGVAFMGQEIVIPRRFYQGFSPILTPTEVELQSNVSVGANLLGSSVIDRGSTLSASLANIPETFIRSAEWLAFQSAFGEGKGFFFGWRPDKYPADVHYCWRDGGVIRPTNSGPRDLMGFDMSARAYNG